MGIPDKEKDLVKIPWYFNVKKSYNLDLNNENYTKKMTKI